MATVASSLSPVPRDAWDAHGYVRLRGFAAAHVCEGMLARAVEICREPDGRGSGPLVLPEARLGAQAGADARREGDAPEAGVSKIFRLHRDPVFAEFAHDGRVLDLVSGLLGQDIDIFLSQFIFKNPGAYGQPWHQDAFYFPFEPDRQVGVWLAVTEATLDNGCLWVLPGSHTEPVHEHLPDRRPDSQYGYVEIVDHEMQAAVPVLMEPGDLLVFDSHLMHRSTDNHSRGVRAAMVYHYSPAGTIDLRTSDQHVVNDWVSARRGTA
jgi:phytanoyl-CoA hydroxylase